MKSNPNLIDDESDDCEESNNEDDIELTNFNKEVIIHSMHKYTV